MQAELSPRQGTSGGKALAEKGSGAWWFPAGRTNALCFRSGGDSTVGYLITATFSHMFYWSVFGGKRKKLCFVLMTHELSWRFTPEVTCHAMRVVSLFQSAASLPLGRHRCGTRLPWFFIINTRGFIHFRSNVEKYQVGRLYKRGDGLVITSDKCNFIFHLCKSPSRLNPCWLE